MFLGRADVAPGPNEPAEGENCNGNIQATYVVRSKQNPSGQHKHIPE